MAWGACYVSGTAKHQCALLPEQNKVSAEKSKMGDFSGFFPFHLTITFSKLIHWIKTGEERKCIIQYNFDIHELIPAKPDWGTKTSTSGAFLSLGLSFNFFSPRWPSHNQAFILFIYSSPEEVSASPHNRLRTSPENHVHLPCLARVPFLTKSLRVRRRKRDRCLYRQGLDHKCTPLPYQSSS